MSSWLNKVRYLAVANVVNLADWQAAKLEKLATDGAKEIEEYLKTGKLPKSYPQTEQEYKKQVPYENLNREERIRRSLAKINDLVSQLRNMSGNEE